MKLNQLFETSHPFEARQDPEIVDAAKAVGTSSELTDDVYKRVIALMSYLKRLNDGDLASKLSHAKGEEKFAMRVALKVIQRRVDENLVGNMKLQDMFEATYSAQIDSNGNPVKMNSIVTHRKNHVPAVGEVYKINGNRYKVRKILATKVHVDQIDSEDNPVPGHSGDRYHIRKLSDFSLGNRENLSKGNNDEVKV